MSGPIEITAVQGLGEIVEGDDLAELIAARIDLADGDVVVVAQKVVSKAEGALTRPQPGEHDAAARRRIAREQARRVIADAPWALVVETRHGFICANAGIDGSNAPRGSLVLLPVDPDASARRIRDRLAAATGAQVAVVVTDTFGRPWRHGQTDVAIGVAGLTPVRDERGGVDREGVPLGVTEVAVADEVAAAADLVRRKAEGLPVVRVRGLSWDRDDRARATDMVREADRDLFPRARGMLAAALAAPPVPSGGPVGHDDLETAQAAARVAGAKLSQVEGTAPSTFVVEGDRLGAAAAVAALLDLGCAARWRDDDEVGLVVEAGRPSA